MSAQDKNTLAELRKVVRTWWKQAQADLKSARHSLRSGDFYVASFLAQQAVEKGLKALLIQQGKGLAKIHNLVILAQEGLLPAELIQKCDALNVVYIETRYPIGESSPSQTFTSQMARVDIKTAKEVLQWVQQHLKS